MPVLYRPVVENLQVRPVMSQAILEQDPAHITRGRHMLVTMVVHAQKAFRVQAKTMTWIISIIVKENTVMTVMKPHLNQVSKRL